MVIIGYDFGKKIDRSPIADRMKRFRNSELSF